MPDTAPNTPTLLTLDLAKKLGAMLADYHAWKNATEAPDRYRRRRRGAGGDECFWATITDYEVVIDEETEEETGLTYSWERLDNSATTGTAAIDLYDGRLALIGETVLMVKGSDGTYRFMWREPFLATMVECDTSTTAYVTDPTDGTRRVTVERVAGYYAVGDQVLLVPSYLIGSAGGTRWTIADRIPMITYTPLDLSATTGDDGDTPAAVQDDPDIVGCEAPTE